MPKRRRNGLSKGLKKSERTAIKEKIREMIGQNYRDDEIIFALNIQPRHFQIYHRELSEETVREFTRGGSIGILSRYAEYGRESIKEMEMVIAEASKKKRTASAAVRAAKLIHDIHIDPNLLKQVDETVAKINKTRTRKAKDGTVYLMTGILRAPDGSPFYGASAQGGKYKYYHNKNIARRYSREDVEGKVLKRIKEYLTESGTLEKIITSFSKNRLIGLPLLDEEIQKLKGEIKTLEKAVNGFSDKLRTATGEEGDGWKKILEVMVSEREKAEVELGNLRERLEGFEKKRHWVNTELREKSLQDCFRLVLRNFDQKSDIEKRRLIRAIIPEAIIHAGLISVDGGMLGVRV